MQEFFTLDPNYSTTRIVARQRPLLERNPGDKFTSILFLPENKERKGEGGLRTNNYFKSSLDNKPLVTVVTVVFNGEKYLEETINSVINQDYNNVEYILIDGGSSDGTIEIIKKYQHALDYWVSEQDDGLYYAMNKGIELTTGDWVYFLNADDFIAHNNVLESVAKSIITHKIINPIVYGKLHMINARNEKVKECGEIMTNVKKLINDKLVIPSQSALISMVKLKKIGKYDITFKIAADYDLFLRLLKDDMPYFINDLLIANMRMGGISSNLDNALILLNENRSVFIKNGYRGINIKLLSSYLLVYIRIFILRLFGEKIGREIVKICMLVIYKRRE